MKKKAYLIGIKGVAMTAMAVYLKEKGFKVTGSDVAETFFTDRMLAEAGISHKLGFSKENITEKYDAVIVTGAHGGMSNPEAVQAKKIGLPVSMHGRYIGSVMSGYQGISVAGCHGKTTTSSMIAMILSSANLDPSYAIGTAYINGLGAAGHAGRGKFFVAEADEYMTCPVTDPTPRFFWQKPSLAVITNIEFDHPDAYRNLEEVKAAYFQFALNTLENGDHLVACQDDAESSELLQKIKHTKIATYGFSPRADFRIKKYHISEGVSFMTVEVKGEEIGEFMVKVPGRHNLLNALAAMTACNLVANLSWAQIKEGLKKYTGGNRRMEKIYEKDRISLYDDYAHHPTEITATLNSVRDWYRTRRLIVIFQPHTYSRTKKLLEPFAQALTLADVSAVAEIFPSAREKADPSVSSSLLVEAVKRLDGKAVLVRSKAEVLNYVKQTVRQGDILMTVGAGNLYRWHADLITILAEL